MAILTRVVPEILALARAEMRLLDMCRRNRAVGAEESSDDEVESVRSVHTEFRGISSSLFEAVLWIQIRIRRIRMFLGLPDTHLRFLSHKYGSSTGSFHHLAKLVRKTLISIVL